MADITDARAVLLRACDAVTAAGKKITPNEGADGLTPFTAVFEHEHLDSGDGDEVTAVLQFLGWDFAAGFWLTEGMRRTDVAPDPTYVAHYNLGAELAARYAASPMRGVA